MTDGTKKHVFKLPPQPSVSLAALMNATRPMAEEAYRLAEENALKINDAEKIKYAFYQPNDALGKAIEDLLFQACQNILDLAQRYRVESDEDLKLKLVQEIRFVSDSFCGVARGYHYHGTYEVDWLNFEVLSSLEKFYPNNPLCTHQFIPKILTLVESQCTKHPIQLFTGEPWYRAARPDVPFEWKGFTVEFRALAEVVYANIRVFAESITGHHTRVEFSYEDALSALTQIETHARALLAFKGQSPLDSVEFEQADFVRIVAPYRKQSERLDRRLAHILK